MTPQLQALTLAFVLMLIYFGYVIYKTDKEWREDWVQNKYDEYIETINNLSFDVEYDVEVLWTQAEEAWDDMMADIGDQIHELKRDREGES